MFIAFNIPVFKSFIDSGSTRTPRFSFSVNIFPREVSLNAVMTELPPTARIFTNLDGKTKSEEFFSEGGLTEAQAKEIKLIKVNINFYYNQDTTALSSYIYPPNFDYGEKSGFHD